METGFDALQVISGATAALPDVCTLILTRAKGRKLLKFVFEISNVGLFKVFAQKMKHIIPKKIVRRVFACEKCVVFARNCKFDNLIQYNMQYISCGNALLAQETLLLSQKTLFDPNLPKSA